MDETFSEEMGWKLIEDMFWQVSEYILSLHCICDCFYHLNSCVHILMTLV